MGCREKTTAAEFGQSGLTAALMLTVASPKAGDLEIELRAKAIQPVIEQARSQAKFVVPPSGGSSLNRAALIVCLPQSISGGSEGAGDNLQPARKHRDMLVEYLEEQKVLGEALPLEGAGFIGVDAEVTVPDFKAA